MIKHIVMFKLKKENGESLQTLITSLNNLKTQISEIKELEVGQNFSSSERAFDIVLSTTFDNREDLQVYAQHPNHLPVVELVKSLCSQSIVVDYEI